ncbi:MAG: hypothetical protein M0031_08055 [Thermaerobacter sp.]|nr:hypothetical protein [Thermaerobacter sp.]
MIRRVTLRHTPPALPLAEDVLGPQGNRLVRAGQVLDADTAKRLAALGVQEVPLADPRLADLPEPDPVSAQVMAEAYQALGALRDALRGPSRALPAAALAGAQHAARELERDLMHRPPRVVHCRIRYPGEDYLIPHAVFTAVLSMAVGYRLELAARLPDIGLGALLSDLGLWLLPPEMLAQTGPLSPEQREAVRRHPAESFRLLKDHPLSAFAKAIVFQHHERLDGSGYPRGASGKDIHPYAQLVGLCDAYAALIADRPYRSRVMPHEALEWVLSTSGFEFGHELVQAFTQVVPPYPVGTFVRLSGGEEGVVAAVDQYLSRPRVRLLRDAAGQELDPWREIDLSELGHQSVLIAAVLPD